MTTPQTSPAAAFETDEPDALATPFTAAELMDEIPADVARLHRCFERYAARPTYWNRRDLARVASNLEALLSLLRESLRSEAG